MNKKERNKYSGELFERIIVNSFENENYVEKDSKLTEEENSKCCNSAKKVLNYLKENIQIETIKHIGKETKNQLGDILINNKISVEIKYLNSVGLGTYHNSTLSYFDKKLKLKSYKDFLKENNYYSFVNGLLKENNLIANIENSSPFTIQESKIIRKQLKDKYADIKNYEEKIRTFYVDYLYKELTNNQELINILIFDLINKITFSKDNYNYKGIVDYYIVFLENKNKIITIKKESLEELKNKKIEIQKTDKSIIIKDLFRIVPGWQNGTGLNNATIRIFLDEGMI